MKDISLHYISDNSAAALSVAAGLGVAGHEIEVHRFPDGELRVRVASSSEIAIIFASLDHPNDKLITLIFVAEALRKLGTRRLILVAPYLCYMRQDISFQRGEAVSQTIIGELLARNFDDIITVEAHLHRTRSIAEVFPRSRSINVSAIPAIANHFLREEIDPSTIIIGPDEESSSWVRNLGHSLKLGSATGNKIRLADRKVEIQFEDLDIFTKKPVILIDDIVSSGSTIIQCFDILKNCGAASVDIVVVHALFNETVWRALTARGVDRVLSTNSVPHPTNAIDLADTLVKSVFKGLKQNV